MLLRKTIFLITILSSVTLSGCSDSDDEPTLPPVGDEWIDPVFARVLQERGYITDAATVTPADVENLEDIDVSGSDDARGQSQHCEVSSISHH